MNKETKDKISLIIDHLLEISNWIKELIITNKEADDSFSGWIEEICKLLDKESLEYKKFDSRKQRKYLRLPRTRPWIAEDNSKIVDLIGILKEISSYKEIEDEKNFKAGEEYESIRYFSKLFQSATKEILILDDYISSNIFDFIEEIENNIKIKILTSPNKFKSNFKTLYLWYKGWNLEAKTHNIANHDRYIILDNNKIYHIWTSLNWIGKNDFSTKELSDKQKIIDIYAYWNNWTVIQ